MYELGVVYRNIQRADSNACGVLRGREARPAPRSWVSEAVPFTRAS